MQDIHSVRDTVRDAYGKIAEQPAEACSAGGSCCCGGGGLSAQIGYDPAELATLPSGADMGLSCGNPTAIAALAPGEVVLDLGSGGGFDCFIAGPRVGARGRVIGVDMTPQMLSKARGNVAAYRQRTGLDNVEFRLGEIEHLPAADASVDVVISNCVLNLSPDKTQVWREIARVLRPGGRVAVSDLALLRPLPDSVKQMVEALIGCVAGAVLVDDTRRMMQSAGLTDVHLTPKPGYIETMSSMQDPLYQRILEALPAGTKPSDYITSLDIAGRKAG
jgi:SAM-dependent methyltransferase